jgi:hypothetical protein
MIMAEVECKDFVVTKQKDDVPAGLRIGCWTLDPTQRFNNAFKDYVGAEASYAALPQRTADGKPGFTLQELNELKKQGHNLDFAIKHFDALAHGKDATNNVILTKDDMLKASQVAYGEVLKTNGALWGPKVKPGFDEATRAMMRNTDVLFMGTDPKNFEADLVNANSDVNRLASLPHGYYIRFVSQGQARPGGSPEVTANLIQGDENKIVDATEFAVHYPP